MGSLRLWLALFVYFEHLGRGLGLNHFLTGMVAVKSFFIISGFLIQLVLLQKYYIPNHKFWVLDFWKSRAMRIYPLYWVVMLGSIVFVITTGFSPRYYHARAADYGMNVETFQHTLIFAQGDLTAKAWYILSQMLIFGYDIGQYIVFNIQEGKFDLISDDPYNSYLWGRSFPLIPQAWSVAIELWFYLLAPFILMRKTAYVVLITAITLYLRRSFSFTCDRDALDIAGELPFFIAGALGCRFYLAYLKHSSKKLYPISLSLLSIVLGIGLAYQAMYFAHKELLFYTIVACALPFLFHSFRGNRWDRFFGDLSYPIYLVHFLAFGLAGAWFGLYHKPLITLVLTLLLAVVLLFFVERPVDRLRHRLTQQEQKEVPVATG